jgi:putative tryptophan/tyrosine transport system substrate-binding protein
MPEIGFLCSGSKAEFAHLLAAFREGLKMTGYKPVGKTPKGANEIRIRVEWADGNYSKLPAKAKALIDKGVQLVAATGGIKPALAAQHAAGGKVPVLFMSGRKTSRAGECGADAKALHLATTDTRIDDDHRYKRLRDLLGPNAKICPLINKDGVVHDDERNWGDFVTAADVAGLDGAFETAVKQKKADAILISADPFFNRRRAQIIRLAAKHKVPVCYPFREYVDAGGLISHGPSLANSYRRLGVWAGLVLGGTKVKDLPEADSGHRELVINVKTARRLGIPSARLGQLLLMADAVIV